MTRFNAVGSEPAVEGPLPRPTMRELTEWPLGRSLVFELARLWTKYSPRGKGWVSRLLGKYFGSAKATIATKSGALLACWGGSLDTYAGIAVAGGTYEPQVVEACVRLTRQHEVFYDIGSNVGLISIETMNLKSGQLVVHSFEPQRDLAYHLAITAGLNGFQELCVHPVLLGESEGAATLYLVDHSIHASVIARSKRARAVTVPQVRLDEYAQRHGLPIPDVVKLDVEGAELRVLNGAREVLGQRPASIVFEADRNMKRFGTSHQELFATLREIADYTFFSIGNTPGYYQDVSAADPEMLPDGNYAAVSQAHVGRLLGM